MSPAPSSVERIVIRDEKISRSSPVEVVADVDELSLRFVTIGDRSAGEFRVRHAVVRLADGSLVQPAHLGAVPARSTPLSFGLAVNYPNPFTPSTTIPFEVAAAGDVRLTVYDVLGQVIRTLVDDAQVAGSYQATWDARDDAGRAVAAGTYLVRLQQLTVDGPRAQVRKVTLLK